MLVNINSHKSVLKSFLCYGFLIIALNLSAYGEVWTLQQCIDTALVSNRSLQIARNSVLINKQKHLEAIANIIPKVTASADYRYYTDQPYQLMPMAVFGGPSGKFKEAQFGVPHNITASLQLAIPLYNPLVYGAIKTSKVATELSMLHYDKTEEQVCYEVTSFYYNLQILHSQLLFIDSNIINTKNLLKNIQLLQEQLLAKGSDVSKVQFKIAQLATQQSLVTSKFEQTLNGLKLILGISFDRPLQIEAVISSEDTNEYTPSKTIDICIAETQKRLLSSELSTLKYSRLPSLSLYGNYGTTGFGYDKQPNSFLNFYPVGFAGLQLAYPLFNGTVTQRKINQKEIELKTSELQLNLLTEQSEMALKSARQQRANAQISTKTAQVQISLACTIYEEIALQQKQGVATMTDVLLADNALQEAQQTYLAAAIDYLKADLELKKVMGSISIKRMDKQ